MKDCTDRRRAIAEIINVKSARKPSLVVRIVPSAALCALDFATTAARLASSSIRLDLDALSLELLLEGRGLHQKFLTAGRVSERFPFAFAAVGTGVCKRDKPVANCLMYQSSRGQPCYTRTCCNSLTHVSVAVVGAASTNEGIQLPVLCAELENSQLAFLLDDWVVRLRPFASDFSELVDEGVALCLSFLLTCERVSVDSVVR